MSLAGTRRVWAASRVISALANSNAGVFIIGMLGALVKMEVVYEAYDPGINCERMACSATEASR